MPKMAPIITIEKWKSRYNKRPITSQRRWILTLLYPLIAFSGRKWLKQTNILETFIRLNYQGAQNQKVQENLRPWKWKSVNFSGNKYSKESHRISILMMEEYTHYIRDSFSPTFISDTSGHNLKIWIKNMRWSQS